MVSRYKPGVYVRLLEMSGYAVGAGLFASSVPICNIGRAGLGLILFTFVGIISDIKWWLYRRFDA